ncbi:MAG TPA: SDR family oxidoreductase [Armatimonadota bacterium]|nr:SDR family oxidoreductase [Armatimonadota bacterium]
MRLEGRTAVVTGGAARVGKAIALALAGRGAKVAFTYRSSAAEAEATLAELRGMGVEAAAARCDQRDPAQVEDAVRTVEEALGPVEVLVNSASIFNRTPFAEATLEDWDAHLEVNLRGPWLFARAVGPGMRERGAGSIVNLVDIAAERPFPGYLPYSVSKAGLVALTKGLARALAPEVRVNAIAPGTVLWPEDYPEEQKEALLRKTPLQRAGSPEDIARTVLFLAEEEYITGAVLPVDGGLRLA